VTPDIRFAVDEAHPLKFIQGSVRLRS